MFEENSYHMRTHIAGFERPANVFPRASRTSPSEYAPYAGHHHLLDGEQSFDETEKHVVHTSSKNSLSDCTDGKSKSTSLNEGPLATSYRAYERGEVGKRGARGRVARCFVRASWSSFMNLSFISMFVACRPLLSLKLHNVREGFGVKFTISSLHSSVSAA